MTSIVNNIVLDGRDGSQGDCMKHQIGKPKTLAR